VLSIGAGFGLTSVSFVVGLSLFEKPSTKIIAADVALLVILGLSYLTRRDWTPCPRRELKVKLTLKELGYAIAFGSTLCLAALTFVHLSQEFPYGAWDAWGHWNLRAKFLFMGGYQWRMGFSPGGSMQHRDYPLLIPASIARIWTYVGNDARVVPQIVAFIFTIGTAALAYLGLGRMNARPEGFLAGAIILGTPFFVTLGAAQYADVPLAFFFLATVVLCCLYVERSHGRGTLILTGLFSGFAAWTKNEGIVFGLAVLSIWFITHIWKSPPRRQFNELMYMLVGLLPMIVMLLWMRISLHLNSGQLLSSQALSNRLFSFKRYQIIAHWFLARASRFGGWYLPVVPPALVGAAAALPRHRAKSVAIAGSLVLAMLTVYFVVYVITPLPLDWLLETSVDRLFVHLWPTVVFMLCLSISPKSHSA
jgi:Dolichyl-phosphate-mannose-protein mannosyltransferase